MNPNLFARSQKWWLSNSYYLCRYGLAQALSRLAGGSQRLGAPQRFYDTTEHWFVQKGRAASPLNRYHTLYPAGTAELRSPTTSDVKLTNFLLSWPRRLPPGFVATLAGGRVWGFSGSVITPEDGVLADVSPNPSGSVQRLAKYTLLRQLKLPRAQGIAGRVALLSVRYGWNYYHWFLDLLPRLYLLQLALGDLASIDKFIVNELYAPFQWESLALLGIPRHKLIEVPRAVPCHLQAEQLIVPSLPLAAQGRVGKSNAGGGCVPPWACDFLRHSLGAIAFSNLAKRPRRLYISRSQAAHRRVLNEAQVVAFLANYGFEAVNLEDYPVGDKIALFQGAEAIVGPHGAGLTNITFCQPGTKVIEFCSPHFYTACFWQIANAVNLEHGVFTGESLPTAGVTPKRLDIVVNLEVLESLLQKMGIQPETSSKMLFSLSLTGPSLES